MMTAQWCCAPGEGGGGGDGGGPDFCPHVELAADVGVVCVVDKVQVLPKNKNPGW
jgi:hypothetical protein